MLSVMVFLWLKDRYPADCAKCDGCVGVVVLNRQLIDEVVVNVTIV